MLKIIEEVIDCFNRGIWEKIKYQRTGIIQLQVDKIELLQKFLNATPTPNKNIKLI